MKNFFLTCLLLLGGLTAFAQSVPQGMKYQAVARALDGQLLADQPIELRMSLYADAEQQGDPLYSEIHQLTTNRLGLFDLTVGQGEPVVGTFAETPWSKQEIWLQVAIADRPGGAFTVVSASRLLTVPYAFHAGTADRLTSEKGNDGVPAAVWSVKGNTRTDPAVDRLGTADCADLVIITDNTEQMRITCAGDINIENSLAIGENLDVGNDATIGNDLAVLNNTDIGVDLTVGNNASIGNDLDVDNNANIDVDLTVGNNASVGNDLDVDNNANIDVDLTVGNNASVGNDLDVDNNANIDVDLTVGNNTSVGNDLDVDNDANIDVDLTVGNNTSVGNDLSVTNNTDLGGTLDVSGDVSFGSSTSSTDCSNGAFTTAGGVGIGENLNVAGRARIKSTLNATGVGTGALRVDGGGSFNGQLYTSGLISTPRPVYSGGLVVNSVFSGSDGTFGSYPLQVSGSNQGMAIRVNSGRSNANNYVSFFDTQGMQGRIEGQTTGELTSSFEFIWDNVMSGLDVALIIAEGVACGFQLDLGEVGVMAADGALKAAQWAELNISALLNVGVAFESGSGDYAEWLEREAGIDKLTYAQVVGVRGGKVSLVTEGADHLMVISRSPIVLGNMPAEGREADFEKVAFMGQVPVRVAGSVQVGDYVLPSGNNDGMAVARNPALMRPLDYANIIGVAWEADRGQLSSLINVAVGINTNDLAGQVATQAQRIAELEKLNGKVNAILAYLETGTGDLGQLLDATAPGQPAPEAVATVEEQTNPRLAALGAGIKAAAQPNTLGADPVLSDAFLDEHRAVFEEQFTKMRAQIEEAGVDFADLPEELSRFYTDPVQTIKDLRDGKFMPTLWAQVEQRVTARRLGN